MNKIKKIIILIVKRGNNKINKIYKLFVVILEHN